MARALLGALLLASVAAAQPLPSTTTGKPSEAPSPSSEAASAPTKAKGTPEGGDARSEEIRREVEARVEQAKKEMREEVRAEMAAQAAARGWQDEWTEQKRKLELLTLDGYFRVRPELLNKMDLGRQADPAGHFLFPKVGTARTITGVNMRLRLDPTLNISEQVRVRMQVDALNNVVFGSNPSYGFTRPQTTQFSVFSQTQVPPSSGINALENSILVRRVYGEVGTPVGILRFGRMGNHWGLGMLHNDGNCLDCDFGDTVDRIQLVTEPVSGWFISPMVDFNLSGPTFSPTGLGPSYPLLNSVGVNSLVLVVARKDTDEQAKAKLNAGQAVFNYGLHFTYTSQKNDAADFYTGVFSAQASDPAAIALVPRSATLFVPDVWAKYERKSFRIELEVAATLGSIGNRALSAALANDPTANQALYVRQFGGVLQSELKILDNKLHLGMEVGVASGDPAPGLGNYPGRRGSGSEGNTATGDIEGRQYACYANAGCPDRTISNFRFNRDYRVDLILWRELLGGITDAMYLKPSVRYDIAEGLHVFGAVIYSRTLFKASSPNGHNANLGVEFNVGARYESHDGFLAGLAWGILLPLGGLSNPVSGNVAAPSVDTAQVIRASLGVKF